MKVYTWKEVMEITENAGGKLYCLPFGGNNEDKFKLKTINLNEINRDYYLSVEECEEEDLDEDLSVITYLINSYNDGCKIPPIVLNSDLTIIDGSHRMGALLYLGRTSIEVFVKL